MNNCKICSHPKRYDVVTDIEYCINPDCPEGKKSIEEQVNAVPDLVNENNQNPNSRASDVMQNVLQMPASIHWKPEQALHDAIDADLADVLICGYDKDGDLFVRSSKLSRSDALWLLEKAKDHVKFDE